MQARKSRSQWAGIIRAFERMGGSHERFCSARGLNLGTFRAWLYRLRRAGETPATVALVPVEVISPVAMAAPAPSDILVAVAGVELRVAIGADIGYVARLVAELRARC